MHHKSRCIQTLSKRFLVCIRNQDLFLRVPMRLTFSISFGVSSFRIRPSFITIGWHTTCRNSPTMLIEECYRPIFIAHLRVHLVPSIKDKLTLAPQKTNESLFLRCRSVSRNPFKSCLSCSFYCNTRSIQMHYPSLEDNKWNCWDLKCFYKILQTCYLDEFLNRFKIFLSKYNKLTKLI